MTKRILITGGSGLLGSELYIGLKSIFNVLTISKTGHNKCKKLDITNIDNLNNLISNFKPEIIINCAAFTDVDNAELDRNIARKVNVIGLSNIIKCSNKNTKIIHISSDYVFDGEKGNYFENDQTFPINYYGKTKLEAENILIGSNHKYLIIRPNVLFTSNLTKKHFLSWILNSLKCGNYISLVTDQISNPTYIPNLTSFITDAILIGYEGLCHFGSDDYISRYDYALKVCTIYGYDNNKIVPLSSNELNQTARRPLNTSLNCTKIKNDLDFETYSIDYSLRKTYLKK